MQLLYANPHTPCLKLKCTINPRAQKDLLHNFVMKKDVIHLELLGAWGAFKGLKSITTFELSTLYLIGGFSWSSKNLLVEGGLECKDQCLDNHYMTIWSNEDLPNAVADYWWPMLALACHNNSAPYQTTSDGLAIYIYQHLHKYYTIVTHSNIHMSHRTGSHARN
jgi:hypothetical protein